MVPRRKAAKSAPPKGPADGQNVPWLHAIGPDVLLDVELVAGAEKTRVVGVADKRLKIAVEAGQGALSNDALVRFVTRALGVARAQVSIVGGTPASRRKTLRLAGVAAARARLRLHPLHTAIF